MRIYDQHTWRPYCHVKDFSNAFITVLNSPYEKVAYNVFNVGDTKENYTKQMLVNEIKKLVPNSKVKYVAKPSLNHTSSQSYSVTQLPTH